MHASAAARGSRLCYTDASNVVYIHVCVCDAYPLTSFFFLSSRFMFTYELNINTLPVVEDLHIAVAVCWWALQPSGSLLAPPPPLPELWVECR